ncbi:type IV pilus assembly protein FimV [Methylocucumis oryzae]|uniref:FimV N-terminal domain-containing protein n=1 Tax=Methylocucumis oryzae TaxID=1632867 RepID=A0A0F3IFD3_9GAMM|nr:FimV/HubP family polar landmark protein [Methylocucumis oryzae]KJV05471.1 hypothetical protein VZ94_17930 [Methylocucumis oryzae]
MHSALNQSLDAEIALVLSPGEQLSNVNITLAAPDKFDELGIPWSYYLSKVRFEKITTPSGGAKIRVTSREALKEPLLEFILEVSWPKGNLYRQFTVLVDPPTTYQHLSRPVITRQYEQDDYAYKPKSKRRVSDEARVDTASKVSGEGYGPVSKNDTLWNIAERLSHNSNASIEQMLIALYQENPHAFYKANINALTAGKSFKKFLVKKPL